jgi:Domain of unknown function (DUF4332)
MLRAFLRFLSRSPQQPTLLPPGSDHVMLYAQIETPVVESVSVSRKTTGAHTRSPSHRHRVLSMKLEYIKLCSQKRCERLAAVGVITAGDLASAQPEELAKHFQSPKKALRILKQYRRAIRFAAAVPGMMPRDAMLLISIHRRSARGLASETAVVLHRDLERFAESSQGRGQLRGRRIPSTRRLKQWIAACKSFSRTPFQTRAA